jgi:hypothetical protein
MEPRQVGINKIQEFQCGVWTENLGLLPYRQTFYQSLQVGKPLSDIIDFK